MDVKTLSATIGHVSSATTLDIYSHITDTMQKQVAVHIDRKIGKTDAQMPEAEERPAPEIKSPVSPKFEPIERKIRKSGTGCVYQVNDNLWEGSFFPRLPDGTRKSLISMQKPRRMRGTPRRDDKGKESRDRRRERTPQG